VASGSPRKRRAISRPSLDERKERPKGDEYIRRLLAKFTREKARRLGRETFFSVFGALCAK